MANNIIVNNQQCVPDIFSKFFLNYRIPWIVVNKHEYLGILVELSLDKIQFLRINFKNNNNIHSILSTHLLVTVGVPQGWIRGPILLFSFINDI